MDLCLLFVYFVMNVLASNDEVFSCCNADASHDVFSSVSDDGFGRTCTSSYDV